MSYTRFKAHVRTWGRSSPRLPPVSNTHRLYHRRIFPIRELSWGPSVWTVTPRDYVPVTSKWPINYQFMCRTFGRLDDIRDLAPRLVKVKTAAIYRKWCRRLWGDTNRITGRYQMKWCASNYF